MKQKELGVKGPEVTIIGQGAWYVDRGDLRDILAKLDASVAAPGPHDFAVRVSHARQSQLSRPPHPTRAFVTCATPLSSGETGEFKSVICLTAKAEYFSQQGWTDFW